MAALVIRALTLPGLWAAGALLGLLVSMLLIKSGKCRGFETAVQCGQFSYEPLALLFNFVVATGIYVLALVISFGMLRFTAERGKHPRIAWLHGALIVLIAIGWILILVNRSMS